MEYQLFGNGPVVLVLKGGHCSRRTHLGHEALAGAGFTVLTPSRPGYDGTPADLGASAEDAARTLVALLDHLNIHRASVIGISAAGPTALTLAALCPERVARLVLESAQVEPWPPTVRRSAGLGFGRFQAWTWGLVRALLRVSPRLAVRTMLAPLSTLPIRKVMAHLTPDDEARVRQWIASFDSGRGGFLNDLQHVSPELTGIRTPILVLYTRHDGQIGPDQPARLLRELPDVRGVDVGSDGHFLWLGVAGQTVRAERLAFLRGP